MTSFRRWKEAIELAFHVEYGAYLPAMAKSAKRLAELRLTEVEQRLVDAAVERKLKRETKRFRED